MKLELIVGPFQLAIKRRKIGDEEIFIISNQ